MRLAFWNWRGFSVAACSCVVAAFVSLSGSRANAEEILFGEFGATDEIVIIDFDGVRAADESIEFITQQDIDAIGAVISGKMPEGTEFLRDTRGVGPHAFHRSARFFTMRTPLIGDKKDGLYLSLGVGRDKNMRRHSNRRFANKVVIGARMDIGGGGGGRTRGEMFAEYRQVQGMDFKGFRGAEQQVSFGFRIKF